MLDYFLNYDVFYRFDKSNIGKLKLNGASPLKLNQGTNAGYQKINSAFDKNK
jgi:hypothetical protein